MLPIFLSSLLVFGLIMMATRMMALIEWVMNKGVHPGQALQLILYLLPNIVLFSLPAVSLMAALIAFLRLSSDNEIIALNSSGVSLYQMLPPVFVLSGIVFIMANVLAINGVPWGNRSFKDTIFQIVSEKVDIGIKERIFCEPFDDVIFFINNIDPKSRSMEDVFVYDQRDPAITSTIVADEARIYKHPKSRLLSILFNDGSIFIAEKKVDVARNLTFKTYTLNINLDDMMPALSSREKSPKEMGVEEQISHLRQGRGDPQYRNEIGINLMEKFTIPVAVFFMGLIGAPLGIQIRSRTRSFGIFVSLMVFLFYYMFFLGARGLCETGAMSPFWGAWIPNLFLLISFIYFTKRVANDKPVLWIWAEGLSFKKNKKPLLRKTMKIPVKAKTEEPAVEKGTMPLFPKEIYGNTSANQAPEHDGDGEYIGNNRMRRFHRPECRWAQKIASGNRSSFRSREEALEKRFRPCEVCNP